MICKVSNLALDNVSIVKNGNKRIQVKLKAGSAKAAVMLRCVGKCERNNKFYTTILCKTRLVKWIAVHSYLPSYIIWYGQDHEEGLSNQQWYPNP